MKHGKTRQELKRVLPADSGKRIQTATLAERWGYSPYTIRKHLCQKGHFFGLTPLKMPNGRNAWPDAWPSDVLGG